MPVANSGEGGAKTQKDGARRSGNDYMSRKSSRKSNRKGSRS